VQTEEIKKAACELMAEIEKSPKTAAEIFSFYTRHRRYIGSKDRRKIADLMWGMIRCQAHLDFLMPTADWPEKLAAYEQAVERDLCFDNEENLPLWVRCECPKWLLCHFDNPEKELSAMRQSAPFILRVNGDRDKIRLLLEKEGLATRPTVLSPFGLIGEKRMNLQTSACYQKGLVEVQDEASQMVCLDICPKEGDNVLDMCAGAGGKTLTFGFLMKNKGRIVAHDISEKSLQELKKRSDRAGLKIVRIIHQLPFQESKKELFDLVCIDSPCSGTGVWRRSPDSKWKLTQEQFEKLLKTQKDLLNKGALFVKNGGRLAYITCSLTKDENENQVTDFLQNHADFTCLLQKKYSPATTQTDGFFVTVLQKNK
jgi:16S rRNA (cytosine967-C5)-methyltransferase